MSFRGIPVSEDIDPDTGLPRTIFVIPADNREKFERQIAKLSRKSERLIGLPIKPVFFGRTRKDFDHVKNVLCFEVLLTAEIPRVNGWTFVARLDHTNETGTIIRSIPNVGSDIPERYRHAEPNCDHCGVRRQRRDTFLLRCDEGEEVGAFRQVGSSCLEDFFGHDPSKIARLAEYLGYALEVARGSEWAEGGMADRRYLDVEEYLAHCAMAVRRWGWKSTTAAREAGDAASATKERALNNYLCERSSYEVTDEDRALASEALAWAQRLADGANLSDWGHNVQVVANAEVMEVRSCGLAASIVGVYWHQKQRRAGAESLRSRMRRSAYQGSVDDRLRDVPATVIGRRSFENSFGGMTHLCRFITDKDAVLVWFASTDRAMDEGDRVLVSGTVKKHETRDGVAQTVLTRCKITPAAAKSRVCED